VPQNNRNQRALGAGGEHGGCQFGSVREAELGGEHVRGADGQHADRQRQSRGQAVEHLVDGAVAAAGDHGVEARRRGRRRECRGVAGGARERGLAGDPEPVQLRAQPRHDHLAAAAAGDRVGDHEQAARRQVRASVHGAARHPTAP
jgi:hypothetical protein